MADRQSQLDEVDFLQAMMSRDGEFEWREDVHTKTISGTLSVLIQLEHPVSLKLVRKLKPCSEGEVKSKTNMSGGRDAQSNSSPVAQSSAAIGSTGTEGLQSISELSSSSVAFAAATSPRKPPPGSTTILHLPSLNLYFQFPPSYPSQAKPTFSLSGKWLNFTQLSSLCHQMDRIWEEAAGGVVLYDWQQFLTNDTFDHLFGTGLKCELPLEFEDPTSPQPHWDERALQDMGHPLLMIPSLVEYDRKQKEQLFADTFFDCEICFLSLQGSKCLRGGICGHIHCRDCLKSHVSTKIDGGDVAKIDCPSADCDELIPPHTVKELVSAVMYERYDRLLLQRTLDGMQDVAYCPQPSCRCVTVKDDSNMVQCSRCRFCFCVLCRRAWHGVSPCKLIPSDLKELRETWEQLDLDNRRTLEKQYGKERLRQAFQEYDSFQWIESNAKRCPTCSAQIQKTQGCNKMTCTHCHSHFCWLCDAVLSRCEPYKHFRLGMSACAGKLFEGLEGLGVDDFWWQ